MTVLTPIVALIVACLCIVFGVIRIGSWLIARRDYAASRQFRDDELVARARSELAACNWTEADEAAYQRSRARVREIAASKRGDLLAAARFAEVQESGHAG